MPLKTPISLALLVAALLSHPAARAQLASSRYTITTIADTTSHPEFTDFSQAYPAINDNGVVVFRATLTDGSQAIYSSVNGALLPLVSTTDTTGLFTGFVDNSVAINNNGTVVFAGITTGGGASTPAIFAVNQGGGTPVPIVTGASDPVDLGEQLQDPAINDNGTVVFEAQGTMNVHLGTHVGGYFEVGSSGGTPTAVYTTQNTEVSVFPPIINSAGQVAFIIDPGVPLLSGDADPGQQVWRVDAPGATPQVLAAVGSNNVSALVNFASASPIDVVDIDATGIVVYNATLTDGTEAIYVSMGAGDMEPFLVSDPNNFTQLGNAAFGKSDALVFYGVSSTAGGTFDGTDPTADYVLYTASGYTITALSSVSHDQINANGQFVFFYSATRNADDSTISGVAVATPGVATTPTPTPTPTPPETPVVTISPAIGKTYENGGAIKLVVSRTGDTSAALTVAYSVKGSAKAGSNYKALPGTVVIPAGSSSVLLKIKIKDDHLDDGTKVLKLALSASDSYTVGAGAVSKIKILNADQ